MSDLAHKQLNRFITAEPAIAAAAAFAIVSYVLTQLVTLGAITDVQASTDTKLVLPPLTAGFILLLGFLVRTVVRPAANYASKLEAEVQQRINELLDAQPELKTLAAPLIEGTAGRTLLAQAQDEIDRTRRAVLAEPVVERVVADVEQTVEPPPPTAAATSSDPKPAVPATPVSQP